VTAMGAGGHAACRTNRTIMQTDPTACHSPIGSFQPSCYVVTAPTATGQLLPSTAHRWWRHDSRQPAMT
jgi:hypothetical protein